MDLGNISLSNPAALPGNSQIVPLIDTTYWRDTGNWPAAASAAAPGKSRGQLGGYRITGTVKPTGQSVTVTFQILTNPTGTTSAAFEADVNVSGTGGTGSVVVASGSTQPFSWLPPTPDWRIIITAGATGPTTLSTTAEIVKARTSGA